MENKKKETGRRAKAVGVGLWLFLLLFLTLSLIWAAVHFGRIGMDEILFTLNMPLEGSGSGFVQAFLLQALLPAVLLAAAALGAAFAYRRKNPRRAEKKSRKRLVLLAAVWTVLLLAAAEVEFSFLGFFKNQLNRSTFIEEEYVDPGSVQLEFPAKKRNLVWIMMESGESSNQDKANGGLFDVNYTPELTQIAKDNVSFSQSQLLEGAAVAPACGWTVAGMVAQFSGLPLKLYKYEGGMGADNSMGKYEQFLPGVTALGDILEDEGYKNYYMLGSAAKFGGQDTLMRQHGNYTIWDHTAARREKFIPNDYFVWWGMEDKKLFDYAKEKLTEISKNPEPFNFYCITIDTHNGGGYVCPLCRNEHPEQYGNVWSCSSRQVNEFVEWLKEQPFYENTTVIITGDHCSMESGFYTGYPSDKHHGGTVRKVYNAILNPAKQPDAKAEKDRRFTTLDFFPTALSALGVEIQGERLGLGTNLFSGSPTLSEEYGYEKLFDELDRKSDFYNEQFLYAQKEQ